MKNILYIILLIPSFLLAQGKKTVVSEIDNSIFKKDNYWRGADGAATIKLKSGKVLWLFSDTFIDQDGTGKRTNAKTMIRNSIAIQDSNSLKSKMTYYYKGTSEKPDDYFKIPGKNWFWTGHGMVIKDKLVVFLIEEMSMNTEIGFEAVGWYVAIIDNLNDTPDKWRIKYFKGSETFGVVVGSSAVMQDKNYVYAYGVKEPATHETYLLRFEKDDLINGEFSNMKWWVNNQWTTNIQQEPKSSSLFIGQTEFSVHYDPNFKKFIQIQTYDIGKTSIVYRLADQLQGPWSKPVQIYTPPLNEAKEFVYTANAHPEYKSDTLIITYNINNRDISRLINNENIYFPKIIKVKWDKE